jgi:hypothetical protein
MKKTGEDHESLLASLAPAGPPDALRERVLERASAALDRAAERDAWTRIYASRPLRAAWAAAVLGLIAANLMFPRGSRPSAEEHLTASSARRVPELRDVVTVPRIDEALVSVDRFAYGRPPAAAPAAAGSGKKEKSS